MKRPSRYLPLFALLLSLALWAACRTKERVEGFDKRLPTRETLVTLSPATFVPQLPPQQGSIKQRESLSKGGSSGFDYAERLGVLIGAQPIATIEEDPYHTPVHLKIAVEHGRVRAYLLADRKGSRPFIQVESDEAKTGYQYIEAAPGQPAQMTGELLWNLTFMVQAADAEARGVTYRVWRDPPSLNKQLGGIYGLILLAAIYIVISQVIKRVRRLTARSDAPAAKG